MTVRELIDELEYLDEDEEIVMQGANSGGYVDSISYMTDCDTHIIRPHWGDDRQVYILRASEQIGSEWE